MQRGKGWGGGDPSIGWGLEGRLEGFGFHSEYTGTAGGLCAEHHLL